jgi:predicted nucleic acid-binding protein
MTAGAGLIDTNVLIRLADLDPNTLPTDPFISVITLAELTVGPLVATDSSMQARRQSHVQVAEADFDPIPVDAVVARAFGRVSAEMRRSGRKTASRGFDALIAATALAYDLPLYTANPDDFAGIDGLDVRTVRPA